MSKCEELRKLLIKWANKNYLPLIKENKALKEENRKLKAELEHEKLRVEQHDFERLRYREMAQDYHLRIKAAKERIRDLKWK